MTLSTQHRAALIAEIKATWPKTWPPLAVELMARFRRNQLEMLADDMLEGILAAITTKGDLPMNNNGQLNVTPITDKQPQPSCKFTIQAVLRGFPVEISGEGRAGDLLQICQRLLDAGAEPPQVAKTEPTKAAGAPTCPTHGTPMKASRKPGSYFCPRQAEDGSGYCPHKS